MELSQGILTIGGLVMIFLGFMQQNEKFIRGNLEKSNAARGLQTKITKETIRYQRMSGIFLIIAGILLLGAAFGIGQLPYLN